MLGRVIDRMRPQVGALAVSANGKAIQLPGLRLPVLDDAEFQFEGPLAGILAGMRWARQVAPSADWLATAATDTPFLPPDLVRRLFGASDLSTVARLAASHGRVHPVFGLWPLALAPALEGWLAAGPSRKVHDWLQRIPHVVVEFDQVDGSDPFFNVNTPDDARVARTLLAEAAP
jgi:molybdopterin-guanine dinucleotide biosynthesis protein A